MNNEKVIVLDFGGQYNQLIARRVRECNVYCEVLPYTTDLEKIKEINPIGIIFTGGPNSVYEDNAPSCSTEIFELGIPVLGICYGNQLMAHLLGGKVVSPDKREYGKTEIELSDSLLFDDIEKSNICWMSHTDYVSELPEGFLPVAKTASTPLVTVSDLQKMKMFEAIILRSRQNPLKTKLKPSFEIDWGEKFEKADFIKREKGEIGLFDLKTFVNEKLERKNETKKFKT